MRIEHNPQTDRYHLVDAIHGLHIPAFNVPQTQNDNIEDLKQTVRARLTHVSHDNLSLIDLSFNGRSAREFESQTATVLQLCGYDGTLLGGANRPDGAFYTTTLAQNYGLIVDAKAYSDGFACGQSDRDKMSRYVQENQTRPAGLRSHWWAGFPPTLMAPDDFRFLFVTSRLKDRFADQFKQISATHSNALGAGITAANLLLFAEEVLTGRISLQAGRDKFAVLDEVTL